MPDDINNDDGNQFYTPDGSVVPDDFLAFNGLNAATGDYGIPPMAQTDLAKHIRGDVDEDFKKDIEEQGNRQPDFRPPVEDPTDLSQTGWGVIFTDNADPAIKEALGPLLNLRQKQATKVHENYFKIFDGPDGYRPGESKRAFLGRFGVGTGVVRPRKGVPYYLLLVGSPEEISFSFQFQLDVQFAVGRIYFKTLQEYANYANNVVAVETGQVKLPRKASFFGVTNQHDKATQLSTQYQITPLYEQLSTADTYSDWQMDSFIGEQATKAQLSRLLGGDQTPALLFTASHGMEFPMGDDFQEGGQGAILCQDWPGPRRWRRKPIKRDFYFAGEDIDSQANLLGLITFCFACFGAGTPEEDEFAYGQKRRKIASPPFLANLPTTMLGRPNGALAFVGHVERAWGYSFLETAIRGGHGANIATLQSTMEDLLSRDPIGLAAEWFDQRFAELATDLTAQMEEVDRYKYQFPDQYEDYLAKNSNGLVNLWTEHNDARGYIIIGDPAVRLPVTASDETIDEAIKLERPTLEEAKFSPRAKSETPSSAASTPTLDTEPALEVTSSTQDTSEIDDIDPYGLGDLFKKTQANVSETMSQFVDSVGTFLKDALEDATNLEVTTYTSDDMANVAYKDGAFTGQGTKLRALTRIKPDGDTAVCVPVDEEGEIDTALWELHLQMVREAQAGRNELIKTAISAATDLFKLWSPG